MPAPIYVNEVPAERSVSKLSRALSKLNLKTDDTPPPRKDQAKSPKLSPRRILCEIPLPAGLSKTRTRDYIHSISITPSGKSFLPQHSEIIPNRLFIADRFTGTDAEVLLRLRITHVVCIVNAWNLDYAPVPSLHYHKLVVPNDVYQAQRLVAKIDDTVDFLDSAMRTNGSRVLVHCLAGVHWSPCMVVAWLMRNSGCPYTQALETVRERREVVELGDLEKGIKEWWALELARPMFPPGRGGRYPGSHLTSQAKPVDESSEAEDQVLDIRRYP